MIKRYFLLYLSFVSAIFNLQGQNLTHFKDFTGNGEVFFNEVVTAIQGKQLDINDTTFWYLDSALAFYNKTPCRQSHVYAVKARMFYQIEKYDEATLNYIKASKLLKQDCPDSNRYYFYNSWSLLAKRIKEFDNSDSLNRLAFKAALNLKDPTYQLNVMINKSLLYSERGEYLKAIHIMKYVYKKAIAYDFKFIKLVSLQNLGAYYIDIAQSDKTYRSLEDSAFIVYQKLEKLTTAETEPRILMDMSNNLGLIYYHREEFKKAEELYFKAIDLARQNSEKDRLLIYYENLSGLKFQMGEYKLSREILAKTIHLKDSLFDAEKYEITKDLETQYKTTKQREKIFELEKKTLEQDLSIATETKRRNSLFFVVGAMLIIIIASLSRLRYVRKSKRIVEREKKRSDDLLLNILPEEVAEELKNTGKSEAKNFQNVTVLFTDFKDFTAASERFSAAELVEELNFYFVSFDGIASKYEVEKIKTIGDSYMAACGVPNSNPISAKTMVNVAIEMMALTIKHNNKNEKLGKPRLDMRIGIHTGPVVAGIVGVKKFQYDIWGDTVNTASRMETECGVNRINISQSTYELIKNEPEFEFEPRGLVSAKGKGKLMMYYVSTKAVLV